METSVPLVEISVKPEPVEGDKEEGTNNEDSQKPDNLRSEELWIKPEPLEDESQDSREEETSDNDAGLDDEDMNEELRRSRQPNAPSRKQMKVFLDFLSEHTDLANCLLRGPTGRAKAYQLWEDIAEKLNTISGCTKTTQQWQRVWSDRKYVARKTAAVHFAAVSTGTPPTLQLTQQDKKILTILGEAIPPKPVVSNYPLPAWPRKPEAKPEVVKPKMKAHEFLAESLAQKRNALKAELEPKPKPKEPEVPEEPAGPPEPKKRYTPWKPRAKKKKDDKNSSRRSESRICHPPKVVVEVRKTDSPKTPEGKKDPPSAAERIKFEGPEEEPPPTEPSQSGVSRPPENSKEDVQRPNPPLSPSISDPPSPQAALPGEGYRGGLRLKACMDPYTKQFIKLEEERLKNDQKRNSELSVIRVNLQQGTAELAEIRQTMQEMLAVMKQLLDREV
ncbi:hypothetical protein HF086_017582 [Spodoptera exigua]|uniref:Regulatory protein zeste n=1 Tax=Spodoptera exigua TaxID=7107 RepID=A0A922SHY1_SPOEX|nr:hypothetical protein HF086_017582 [Spodoptera exigua]